MAVLDTSIQQESQDRYLTYALSVVSGRALPDVRDGLKPVQRRILFAMFRNLGLKPSGSHRKSAKVVGEVLACFHPHGDVACYEAMVRMAQDFSLRYPLVDGQGNFGSLDGDNAAAYRYTEAKLRQLAVDVIGEIDEETVSFRDNFDATLKEPVVLPSRVPNLLINGAQGIAVGMSTSIPPHNISDVIDAALELIKDPDTLNSRLVTVIKAPDFPTGCQILNTRAELVAIYETGRGSIRMRANWEVEEGQRGKRYCVVTSVPYGVNKSTIVEKIAQLIVDRKVPQLVDIRDESTDVVRVVIELASGADENAAMAYLFKYTSLESTFPVALTCLVPDRGDNTRPETLSLKGMLEHFLTFRHDVVRKRLEFEKRQLLARIHILDGFAIIFDGLDEAIKIVRKSEGRSDAAEKLRARFKLTEIQSFAVVDLKIYQLSRTNIDEVRAELKEKLARVKEIDEILKSKARVTALVKADLEEVAKLYGDRRRSQLVRDDAQIEIKAEDYVVQEDVFALVTADGWLKRIRQGNEVSGTRLREGDSIVRAHPLNTLDYLVIFTNLGSVYSIRVADIPSSSGYGDPVQKLFKFKDGEVPVSSFGLKVAETGTPGDYPFLIKDGELLTMLSKDGLGFHTPVTELTTIKRSGKRVMKVKDGDGLVCVVRYRENLAMISKRGYALLIQSKELPTKESAVMGVQALGLKDDDSLAGAVSFRKGPVEISIGLVEGKTIEIKSNLLAAGHRALKGNKAISRGEVRSMELKAE